MNRRDFLLSSAAAVAAPAMAHPVYATREQVDVIMAGDWFGKPNKAIGGKLR